MEGMRRLARLLVIGLAVAAAAWPVRAAAQEVALADRAPRFFQASPRGGAPVEIDAARNALLRRVVSLNVDRPTVGRLLEEVERQTGLRFYYGQDVLSPDRRVALRADSITVATALVGILMDAGVDAVLSGGRRVALVKKRQGWAAGSVTGRVTDVKTNDGLVGAEVLLEGTRWHTATAQDGRYRLAEVEPGSYTLTVRRVGYAKQSRTVAVVDAQELTADVVLQPVATQLNEIVTTVTGDQRRVELGHVVGRINADSVVKEAPVSSLSELLSGRVPGLQVFQSQGTVGGQVHVQVRGPNSINLSTEPIVVVDGVRYTNGAVGALILGAAQFGPGDVEARSPLNDLNPNDIESIEVVKGPSAATLYGTDAANGVIVVTTKRGRPGSAHWNVYAKGTTTAIPTAKFPNLYWGWRTVGGLPSTSLTCPLASAVRSLCVQDSVTVLPNPLNDPQLSVFRNAPGWQYGASMAGGRQDMRYHFSGDLEDATGPIGMPPAVAEQLRRQRGVSVLPDEQLSPNAFSKVNLRANVATILGGAAEVNVNTGYVHSANRALGAGLRSPYSRGVALGAPTRPYGLGLANPAESFAQTSTEQTDRFFGGARGQWTPMPWLIARAAVGLDLTTRNRYNLVPRGYTLFFTFANGAVGNDRIRQLASSADLSATVTLRRGRLSSRTSVGAQYVRNLNDALSSFGTNLPPGATSVGEAATVQSDQSYQETVTLGSYLEEVVGLNERLFLTGALRVDGASSFGQRYEAAAYPKAGISWLLSEEPFLPHLPGLNELRLRYAFGASGRQPQPEWARPSYGPSEVAQNGASTTVVQLIELGNPSLRPERVREHELGFDAVALHSRLKLGLTWYRRRTVDQIVSMALAPGLGSIYTNLGRTTQHGFEAELGAQVLDTRFLSWDLTFQHALHRTKLVELGDAAPQYNAYGGWVEGYPLGARFVPPLVGYADANGDGVIVTSELQLGATPVYVGESTPPSSEVITTAVGLFDRRLRLSALLERRTGFTQVDQLNYTLCTTRRCRGAVDPGAPLAEQVAAATAGATNGVYGFVEPGDFTRLREVTIAVDLPAALTRPLRVRSATLSVAGRNLALWTDFSGPDPESATVGGFYGSAAIGGVADGIPQGRSWSLRIDLGL